MSKARIETYGSTVDLLGIDTDGAMKKIARSVVSTGIGTALNVTSGTYTPTFANVSLVSSFGSSQTHIYQRIGNFVSVRGTKSITTSGAGAAEFRLTLPFASTLVSGDCYGTATADSGSVTFTGFAAYPDTVNNQFVIRARGSAGGTYFVAYGFFYEVK